jgi:hypothetical protein
MHQLMLIPDNKVHLIRQLLNDEIKIMIEDQRTLTLFLSNKNLGQFV